MPEVDVRVEPGVNVPTVPCTGARPGPPASASVSAAPRRGAGREDARDSGEPAPPVGAPLALIASSGGRPGMAMPVKEFQKYVTDEVAKYAKVITATGMKAD